MVLVAASVPSVAQAAGGDGGAGVPLPAQPPAPVKVARPFVTDVRCSGNPTGSCLDAHRVDHGGSITLRGRNLAPATRVVFYGRSGRRDDVTAPVAQTTSNSLAVTVPANAASGPVAALTAAGPRSARWSGLIVDDPSSGLRTYAASNVPGLKAALSQPRRITYAGLHKAVFTYQTQGQALDLTVNLISETSGTVVRSWPQGQIAPNTIQRIAWDGSANGKPLADGRYFFEVTTASGPAAATAARPGPGQAVSLTSFAFPLRGKFDWGTAINRFGAPRGGRSHAGHDLLSNCGTPIVAASGGRVLYSGYGGAAGNYVAIDSPDYDFAYMHLREHALVYSGDRVYTGQLIGYVGDTGDATTCHLHFEMWTPPGWYKGGRAIDPLPYLKRWRQG